MHLRVNCIVDNKNLEMNLIESMGLDKIYCAYSSDNMLCASITGDKYSGWEGEFNKDEFMEFNKENINRIKEELIQTVKLSNKKNNIDLIESSELNNIKSKIYDTFLFI